IVIVRAGSVDATAIDTLKGRVSVLEDHLAREFHRYRSVPFKPFQFVVYGPVAIDQPPPTAPGEELLDLARHTWNLWSWTRDVDRQGRLDTGVFDSVVYVVVRAPSQARQRFVEGASEQGGRIGVLEVEL